MPRGRPKKISNEIAVDKIQCSSCLKYKTVKDFYISNKKLDKTGRFPYCKVCLKSMCLDKGGNLIIDKFQNILRDMDRPYIYFLLDSAQGEASKNGGQSYVFGIYMKNIASLKQYVDLKWSDSIFESKDAVIEPENQEKVTKKIIDKNFELTDEIIELFGAGFSEDEYRAMFRKYNFLKNNYPDTTAFHEEALVTYVRFKVKEEFAIASGQVSESEKWARMSNAAATAAKINPSQLSKADLQGGLNNFSELVKAVEQNVDIIPILPKFKFRPNDALDFVIWCYVNYIRDLKGLPNCKYEDIYKFYDKRKEEYIEQYGDPYGIFTDDTTEDNRETMKKFVLPLDGGD